MRIPKRYGDYQVDKCPFCKRQATVQNDEGVPVCPEHKNLKLPELKCVCGRPLEQRQGKFGVFFNCLHCGSVSKSKVFELNDISSISAQKPSAAKQEKQSQPRPKPVPREIVVNADDPYFCR